MTDVAWAERQIRLGIIKNLSLPSARDRSVCGVGQEDGLAPATRFIDWFKGYYAIILYLIGGNGTLPQARDELRGQSSEWQRGADRAIQIWRDDIGRHGRELAPGFSELSFHILVGMSDQAHREFYNRVRTDLDAEFRREWQALMCQDPYPSEQPRPRGTRRPMDYRRVIATAMSVAQ